MYMMTIVFIFTEDYVTTGPKTSLATVIPESKF
jgi:hypothetical protein